MKYLEIKDGTGMVFDITTPAGLYESNDMLWFVPGFADFLPQSYPLAKFPWRMDTKQEPKQQQGYGISEETFLKAIAISQKPELIRDI